VVYAGVAILVLALGALFAFFGFFSAHPWFVSELALLDPGEKLCLEHLAAIAKACQRWAADHDGEPPASVDNVTTCAKMDPEEFKRLLVCPADRKGKGPDYAVVITKNLNDVEDPHVTIMLVETANYHHGKRAVAYVDGRCEMVAWGDSGEDVEHQEDGP
jgi:hypothetical protein